ncbi:hypothetical protein J1781_25445 [Rahnella sp. C60]|uniref:hypothetical protein n=1 Tax=Rahnella perminowiae TaxID=2816244 RepID=UPI001C26F202|nr:hypothetical protein [Rahnella perminowiae]MBU9818176.1 hypothetical protein [Rahnella perminowiae]
MSKHCENCGCAIRSGYCTNCQEEAYIAFVQAPEMDFSREFMDKAWEQVTGQKNAEQGERR